MTFKKDNIIKSKKFYKIFNHKIINYLHNSIQF